MYFSTLFFTAFSTILAARLAPAALAAPQAAAQITLCSAVNFQGTCIPVSVVADDCVNLDGGLTILNKELSSVKVPGGMICTLFEYVLEYT